MTVNISQYCCHRTIPSASQQLYRIISSDSHLCLLRLMKAAIDWWWRKHRLSAWQGGGVRCCYISAHRLKGLTTLYPSPATKRSFERRRFVLSCVTAPPGEGRHALSCRPLLSTHPCFPCALTVNWGQMSIWERKGVLWSRGYTKTLSQQWSGTCMRARASVLPGWFSQSNPMELAAKTR